MSLARQYQQAHQERLSRLWPAPPMAIARKALGPVAVAILTLKETTDDDRKYRVTSSAIINAVLTVTGIPMEQFSSECRFKRVVFARHVAFYLCRTKTSLSYPEIGRRCGNRDHSTVHHGCKKVVDNMITYSSTLKAVEDLLFRGQERD